MRTGLERLAESPSKWLQGARVGLVVNPTSVSSRLQHAVELLGEHPEVDLQLLFGPEHGLTAAAQDMVAVNGEDLGLLGERAQVVERMWDPQGQVTPTPEAEEPEPDEGAATPAVEPTPTPSG